MDRALVFGTKGWGFKSLRAHIGNGLLPAMPEHSDGRRGFPLGTLCVRITGFVAQLVEHLPLKEVVVGSNPTGPTQAQLLGGVVVSPLPANA